jgi:hypothetical protein
VHWRHGRFRGHTSRRARRRGAGVLDLVSQRAARSVAIRSPGRRGRAAPGVG